MGYKTYQNVLQLWEGSYLSRTAQSFYDWGVIAQHFEAMRLLGELQDTMKPLPSIDGQLSLMTAGAEERKPSAFTFSQEIIDAVLTRGSGISEGKMRIYEQFHKSLSAKENADFLKNEYGWGGAYPVIVGAGIDEQHDGKGIRISKGIGSDKPHIDLKWSQVEKRIGELIKLDRYLNPKEKAQYPEWLQRQEERRAELAEERRNREILSTAPSEKAEPKNERYEYHLGSTVYLGANEYEILSFDDERVMLYDTQFPLFNKEMTRTEFDSKVQENPLNDHLKVAIKQPEEKAVEYDIGMGYLGNGLTVWNRAVEVNGDYQNIAHISPEGEITFYVQDLPQSVVERIEQAAEREKPKDAALPEFYQAYLKTKADNPSSLLLYQMGDFFEAYAEDAEVVGTALDLTQTTRAVDHNTRVPMVGFPQHRLETYLTMLTDRGYDVAVNALEDGKRITRTVVSTTKEAPIESKPIGRIDYLGTDGKVGESIEYTSPYQFEKDIKEENYYGVPISIVLYKDKDDNTIPHGFIAQLDPPPKGFEIIDSPYLPENALDKAKHLIDDFCREEYQREDGADYTDLTDVGVAYDAKMEAEKNSVAYDNMEISGGRAVWKDVLAVYAVKTNTDTDNPQEVATMDESKKQILSDIFWEMNSISSRSESHSETEITETDDGNGNIVQTETTVTKTTLYITVSHLTVDEMADLYGFDAEQREYLAELLKDKNNSLWAAVLYGIRYSDDQIVTVALSQVGNVGGEPYWSWYGFGSRVEWCACFVSWCADQCGYIDTGVVPKYAGCVNGVQWFKDRGQWIDGSAEPVPGMIIFFDWDNKGSSGPQDGQSDHTGIVQKVENGIVYTVEGNSGDSCRGNQYSVGHYEILGYGVPQY